MNRTLIYLMPVEALFLDAAVGRLIPADELGPGAREAGVTDFIDGQLASAWGVHGRNYRSGPWKVGMPQQGYQLPLTPQELYRCGIEQVNAWCVRVHGVAFALLKPAGQDAVLQALERGSAVDAAVGEAANEIADDIVIGRDFFELLWRNTQEGFFADPIHRGNRDMIGWKLIGFPGVAASDYPERMGRFDEGYRVIPVSIADIIEGRVEVDAQGGPIVTAIKDAP